MKMISTNSNVLIFVVTYSLANIITMCFQIVFFEQYLCPSCRLYSTSGKYMVSEERTLFCDTKTNVSDAIYETILML